MKKQILSLLLATSYLTCMGKYSNEQYKAWLQYKTDVREIRGLLVCLLPLTYLSYKGLTASSKKVLEDKAIYEPKSSARYEQYRQDKKLGSYALWLLKNNAPRVKIAAMQTAAASALCVTTALSAMNLTARYFVYRDYRNRP